MSVRHINKSETRCNKMRLFVAIREENCRALADEKENPKTVCDRERCRTRFLELSRYLNIFFHASSEFRPTLRMSPVGIALNNNE